MDRKHKLEKQIITTLTALLKVFSWIFIFLIALSYFSVKSLTEPLTLIIQKIKRTTLSATNKPLEYHVDDEFGLLIGEYNQMLKKLEDSKSALAQSQKESAWREMAKQVAHEIKNPLTPMKLTIQQLQRILDQDNNYVKKTFRTLLEQIETLSDIATSFSSFAKMPLPKEEKFELNTILKQTISLHSNEKDVEMETDIIEHPTYVIGDSKLMSRIFTNLILNGIQSVSDEKKPLISISSKHIDFGKKILVEIKDNGQGIPEYIQHKVFVPNFTTKSDGSGIGLAIAKRGIEHSGGNIWFETSTGKGTSFYIEMPISEN